MNEQEKAEELLWQAANRVGDDLGEAPDELADEELAALRQGRLPAARQQEIELRLRASAALRRRAARLAGAEVAAPPELRERVLEAFDQGLGQGHGRLLAFRPRGRTLAGFLVAATLLLASGLLLLQPTEPWPAELRYELHSSGLRQERGTPAEPAAPVLRALPETRVEIELIPDRSIAAVELTVFAQRAGQKARRLHLDPAWVKSQNGLIRIAATAADLLGAAPGQGRLYLLLSPGSRSWPETFGDHEDPALLLGKEDGRLLVLPFEVALAADALPTTP